MPRGREKNELIKPCIQKCISFVEICLHRIDRQSYPCERNSRSSYKPPTPPEPLSAITYHWEGTVSDLMELSIVLHKGKLIRKSTGELLNFAELIRIIEEIFGVKISNIYSRKTRVMERKKNAAPFLERMCALYLHEVDKLFSQ